MQNPTQSADILRHSHQKWAVLSLLLVSVFAVYFSTLAPSVVGGDSGEFITSVFTSNIAHPPGYPLYHLLGKPFCWLPWGSVGWRMNLFSAVMSLGSIAFIFLILERLTKGALAAAFLGAGLFAFSPLTWHYSITAEVFALNNFFVSILIYLAILFKDNQRKILNWTVFVAGLGLSNHHTLVFVAFPIIAWMGWMIYASQKQTLKISLELLKLTGLFLLGLLPYLYIPWAASKGHPFAWGDLTSVTGVIKHFLRTEYGTFQLAKRGESHRDLFTGLFYYLKDLLQQSLWIGLPLAALGIRVAFRSKNKEKLGWLLIFTWIFYLGVFNLLSNLDISSALLKSVEARFWLQANVFAFIFIGLGFAFLESLKSDVVRKVLPFVSVLLVAGQIGVHYASANLRDSLIFRNYGLTFLQNLPNNSVLVGSGDMELNIIRYLLECEKIRPDVRLLDPALMRKDQGAERVIRKYPDVFVPEKIATRFILKEFLDGNYGKFPLYLTRLFKEDESWKQGYKMFPQGLYWETVRENTPVSLEDKTIEANRNLPRFNLQEVLLHQDDPWEEYIENEYWRAWAQYGTYMLDLANHTGNSAIYLSLSLSALQRVTQEYRNAPAEYFKELGLAYKASLKMVPQNQEKMVAAWKTFLEKADPADPSISEIQKELGW